MKSDKVTPLVDLLLWNHCYTVHIDHSPVDVHNIVRHYGCIACPEAFRYCSSYAS